MTGHVWFFDTTVMFIDFFAEVSAESRLLAKAPALKNATASATVAILVNIDAVPV